VTKDRSGCNSEEAPGTKTEPKYSNIICIKVSIHTASCVSRVASFVRVGLGLGLVGLGLGLAS